MASSMAWRFAQACAEFCQAGECPAPKSWRGCPFFGKGPKDCAAITAEHWMEYLGGEPLLGFDAQEWSERQDLNLQ